METVKFSDSIDLKVTVYAASAIPTSQTDAVVLKDIDISTATTSAQNSPNMTSVGGNTQGTLYIDFVKGTGGNLTLTPYLGYEGNPDAVGAEGWFQESDDSDASGVLTLNGLSIVITADCKKTFHFPIGAARAYKWTASASAGSGSLLLAVGLRSN